MKTKTKNPAKKSKAAAAAPEPTLAEREARHYQEIRALETTCDRLEGEYEAAKAAASGAKSLWSEAVARLRESIRRGPDPQLELPLQVDWLATPVGEAIELTEKQAEKLAELGIRTVGQLDEIRVGAGLETLPGIGRAIADKWEDQLLDWLAAQHKKAEAAAIADMDNGGDEDQDGDA
jgi:hypothetical protein